jgi:hypothetical protein
VAIIVADAVQSARRVSVMEENRAVELAAKMMSKEKIENIKFILSEDYVFSTLLKAIEPDGFVETSSSDSDSISVKIEEEKINVHSVMPVHQGFFLNFQTHKGMSVAHGHSSYETYKTNAKRPEPVTRPEDASKYRYDVEHSHEAGSIYGPRHSEDVKIGQNRTFTHYIH